MEVMIYDSPDGTFQCHHVFCGDYRSGETILIANTGSLTFWAVNGSDKKPIELTLKSEDVGKVVFCHSKRAKVLFLYPTPPILLKIQQELSLSCDQMRYSTTAKLSRVAFVLAPNDETEKLRNILLKFGKLKLDEMTCKEAAAILSHYKEYLPEDYLMEEPEAATKTVHATNGGPSPVQQNFHAILTYPPTANSGRRVSIFTNDYLDLAPQTYLNDAIIDFYLQFVSLEMITSEFRERIHIFDSFFWKKLSTAEIRDPDEPQPKLSAEEIAKSHYQRVSKWDEKVKLFEKDFIFVPININEHWLLAVICFAYLEDRKLDFDTNEDIDPKFFKNRPIRQACILVFDSLGIDRPNVSKMLREYLRQRFIVEKGRSFDFSSKEVPGCYVKVPKQNNYFDCGIFLLQYVEHFCILPIQDFRTPIKGLENWFPQDLINGKRKYIKELIESLVAQYEPANLPLPVINFPCDYVDVDNDDRDSVEAMDVEFQEILKQNSYL